MVIRIALYSHDSVGLGHVRRNVALAHALNTALPELLGEEVTGLLVTGQSSATAFTAPDGWDWLALPGVTTGDQGYRSRHLDVELRTLTSLRGDVVRAGLAAFAPDLVIVDRHAFGVQGELEPALRAVRAANPAAVVVLGLRDVLDRRSATSAEWKAIGGAGAVRELYDAVWVYGDPAVHDPAATGEIPRGLHDLVAHTGFLANGRLGAGHSVVEEPFVLTTVGGGSDGRAIAEAAVAAEVPAGYRHVVVTGPQMPAEHRRAIRAAAGPATTVVRSVPDALALLRRASAVVSMGGYNTVCEVMSTTVPALIVPRSHRRQEQRLRAEALEARGAVEVLAPAEVSAERLGAWFAARVGTEVQRTGIDLDGLAAVGPLAARLVTAARGTAVEEADRAV
ncbi:glycosyltransferase family protein [Rathayibacter sp. VKM Ac-2857]|uniref:glycosyltransferase family protein n=1 Tax=Rathayibacter sp. VKM Ac-2857 TaxID=2739020 RepID=UPI00156407C3|nr:glycosyltransferase [Rathayibacter sp. VKM Ac-2857]NQX15828.1 glycosyl transferase family 28 [Rathayibacter sp. VKM Ac-2857]